MTATIDTSRLSARLNALRADVRPSVASWLPYAALEAIEASGYANPDADEAQGVDPLTLLGEVRWDGNTAKQPILLLYDWVIDPEAAHCSSDTGQDCPTFAAGGPYTFEQIPAHPGDGTTPCADRCRCQLIARDVALDSAAALAVLSRGVLDDVKAAWGSV